MTTRNPMNERYSDDNAHSGVSKKSAASAKPKSKAASSVTVQSTAKTAKEKKQERKAREAKERQRERELDLKYSKPDTEEYKTWKRNWWIALAVAVVLVAASWFLQSVQPYWISMVVLFLAYAAIIFAFWIDLSKIRKITRAYQEEMVKKEAKANKGKTKKQIEAERQAEVEAERARIEEQRANSFTGKLKKKFAKNKTFEGKVDDVEGAAEGAAEAAEDAVEKAEA